MTTLQNTRLDKIPKPVADIKVEAIEGELLLYHPRNTVAVYLNPTAAVIWGLCDGQRQVREIIQLIEESYPDSKPTVTEDVLATLADLYEKKVLVPG
ncbi:MAG: PqqD family protein [Bradyrhizobium sp.]|uniref:PqqD family protein n=1 Tax=Bradyrhizobium sp. TaxID=376 RepID=UPI001220D1A8|nr:PqqD family protein [Bradyrhizobium sp.]THD70062.1 MAG: PqqD family protein [Bradyrhizobium sp.]